MPNFEEDDKDIKENKQNMATNHGIMQQTYEKLMHLKMQTKNANILLLNLFPSKISRNNTYLGQYFDCSPRVTFSTAVIYQILLK